MKPNNNFQPCTMFLTLLLPAAWMWTENARSQSEPAEDRDQEVLKDPDPDLPCKTWDLYWTCVYNDRTPWGECDYAPTCLDGKVDASWDAEGEKEQTVLGTYCPVIEGTAGPDTIYVGSIVYPNGSNYGELGYCKNGVLYNCTSPLPPSPWPVKLKAGHDTAGTTDSSPACGAAGYKIGPWSSLQSQYQSLRLAMYGCQGQDTMRGTPNQDLSSAARTRAAARETRSTAFRVTTTSAGTGRRRWAPSAIPARSVRKLTMSATTSLGHRQQFRERRSG